MKMEVALCVRNFYMHQPLAICVYGRLFFLGRVATHSPLIRNKPREPVLIPYRSVLRTRVNTCPKRKKKKIVCTLINLSL